MREFFTLLEMVLTLFSKKLNQRFVGGRVRGDITPFSPNILKTEVLNAQKKGLVDKNANAQDSPPTDFDCIITDPTTIESVIHRNESSLIVYIGRPELHI